MGLTRVPCSSSAPSVTLAPFRLFRKIDADARRMGGKSSNHLRDGTWLTSASLTLREARESSADGKGRLNPQDLPQETGLTGRAASVPAARLIYARRDPPSLGLRFES